MRRLTFLLIGFAGLNFALVLAAPGCGSSVIEIGNPEGGGGAGGESATTSSSGVILDGGVDAKDALPDYEDPGCPDVPPPEDQTTCNAWEQGNGDCAEGEGCYIFVAYPSEPCQPEIYGTVCQFAGTGKQQDPCGGQQDCGGGFVCVITGAGTQCVQLCPLEGPSGCPSGLVCEAIDVVGYGGCF